MPNPLHNINYCCRLILLFLIFNFACFTSLHAQSKTIDSLKYAIKTAKHDTIKIKALNNLAWEFSYINPDSAIIQSNLALELSQQTKWKIGIAQSEHQLGSFYDDKGDYSASLDHYHKALNVWEELFRSSDKVLSQTSKTGKSKTLGNIGVVYRNQGDYPNALSFYFQALKMKEELGEKNGIAKTLGNIGTVYYSQGDFPKALSYYLKALKMAEELGVKSDIAAWLGNIGVVYKNQGDYSKALSYYFKALKMKEELGDKSGIAGWLANIGVVYRNQGDYFTALSYYFKALKMTEELGDKNGIAIILGNIGSLYTASKQYKEAEEYLKKALALSSEIEALDLIKDEELHLSELYEATGKSALAFDHYKKYIAARDTIFNEENTKKLIKSEMNFEFEKKEHEAKLEQEKKEVLHKAEVQRQKTERNAFVVGFILILVLAIVIFRGYKQKQKANDLLEEKNRSINNQNKLIEEKNVELEKLSIVARETVNGVIIADANGEIEWANQGFTRLLGYDVEEFKTLKGSNLLQASSNPEISKLIAYGVNEKKSVSYEAINITSSGKELWVQSTLTPIIDEMGVLKKIVVIDSDITELKKAEKIILKKNKDITDSIEYAQRIQHAMLPSENEMKKYLGDHVLFYAAKDIVSGDFYWLYGEENGKHKKVIVAVADCTGHGVPGALMSMIGADQLNRIVREEKLFSPGKILSELNKSIKKAMQQVDVTSKDGMEIGICLIDTEKKELCYAGANRPMYFFPNASKLTEKNFDRMAIGGDTPFEYDFQEERFSYTVNDAFYLFSDGYTDQFGGEKRKKFMTGNFKDFLSDIQDRTMPLQEELIKEKFISWKGNNTQIDDVTVLGMKLF